MTEIQSKPPASGNEPPRRVLTTPARLAGVAVLAVTFALAWWVLTNDRLDDVNRLLATAGVVAGGVLVVAIGAHLLRK